LTCCHRPILLASLIRLGVSHTPLFSMIVPVHLFKHYAHSFAFCALYFHSAGVRCLLRFLQLNLWTCLPFLLSMCVTCIFPQNVYFIWFNFLRDSQ
jgi:hypothetical protein